MDKKNQTGAVQPGCVACSGAEGTDRELQCGPSGPCLGYPTIKLLCNAMCCVLCLLCLSRSHVRFSALDRTSPTSSAPSIY
eukprot:scaffold964_cov107-Skeletonema_marinoi.AAC.1